VPKMSPLLSLSFSFVWKCKWRSGKEQRRDKLTHSSKKYCKRNFECHFHSSSRFIDLMMLRCPAISPHFPLLFFCRFLTFCHFLLGGPTLSVDRPSSHLSLSPPLSLRFFAPLGTELSKKKENNSKFKWQ